MNDQSKSKHQLFEEVTIASKQIFKGKVISLQIDTVRLPNGKTSEREIVKHPGAVAVLAINDNKMIVVEQYRKPLEKSQIEIPAGKLEPGEDPAAAAGRELEEETGFKPVRLQHVCSFYTSPGFADELIHLYFTEEITQGDVCLDEDEFVRGSEISLEVAKQYISEGRISDAKTITAVYAWQLYQLTGSM